MGWTYEDVDGVPIIRDGANIDPRPFGFDPLEGAFPTEWVGNWPIDAGDNPDDHPCFVCGGDEHNHGSCDTQDPQDEEE